MECQKCKLAFLLRLSIFACVDSKGPTQVAETDETFVEIPYFSFELIQWAQHGPDFGERPGAPRPRSPVGGRDSRGPTHACI